jgi:hypothetical protein
MLSSPMPVLRTLILAATFSGALLTTGCAQMRSSNYYAPPAASSQTDAYYQAQGGLSGGSSQVQAPSQIQIPLFGSSAKKPDADNGAAVASDDAPRAASGNAALPDAPPEIPAGPALPAGGANAQMKGAAIAAAAPEDHPSQRAFLPQAETFVGTVPCMSQSDQCDAQRITLTLGPNGRWRSRSTYLANQGQAPAPQAEQGCWNVVGDRPAHLLLLDPQGNPHAELVASANNVLSIKTILGRAPTLNYTLTRQPDLDSIDELSKQPLPNCE